MQIPAEKIEIADEKLTDYLLVLKEKNDKSAFLLKLGYSKENWKDLRAEIVNIATHNEAVLQMKTPFGDM